MKFLSYTSKTAIVAFLSLFVLNLNAFAIDPHVAVGAEGYKQDCGDHTVIVIDRGFDMNEPGLKKAFTKNIYAFWSGVKTQVLYTLNEKLEKNRKNNRLTCATLCRKFPNEILSNPTNASLKRLELYAKACGLTSDEIIKTVQTRKILLHGSHVAGIIAGKNIGIADNCKIIPIDVINSSLDDALEDALRLVKMHKISAINLSCSLNPHELEGSISKERMDLLQEICRHTVIFNAPGNTGIECGDNDYTKSLIELSLKCQGRFILVGNTAYDENNQERLWKYSEKCGRAEYYISAPGTDIESYTGLGQIEKKSGTSMACPLALGVYINLLAKLQADYGEDITLDDAVKVLLASARKSSLNDSMLFDTQTVGKGVVDLGHAISIAPQILGFADDLNDWEVVRTPKLEQEEKEEETRFVDSLSYAASYFNPWAYGQ